jgi:glycosyltransferase involved in cell wall biosynthesis
MTNRKKIVIIAPSVLPIPAIQSGGYEQFVQNILNVNEELNEVDFILISKKNTGTKKLRKKFINTKFHDFSDNIFLRIFNNIGKRFNKLFSNKVHYNFYITQIQNILKKLEYDKVLIIGNVDYINPISEIVKKENLFFYLATEILSHVNVFHKCGKIIVGNQRLVNLVLDNNKLLKLNEVVNLIPGIDIDFFRQSNADNVKVLRKKLGIPDSKKVICYVGRIVTSKGVNVLLEAILKINNRDDYTLLLIGSIGSNFGSTPNGKVSDVEGIIELISKLGDKCISTGFVANEELADYLALADIGVVPSICEDVAPASYLQFQAIGIPTIVSNGGGIPEFFSPDYSIMVNRGNNMIEELQNALVSLLEDENRRNTMGKFAFTNSEKFSMNRYFKDLIDIIEN